MGFRVDDLTHVDNSQGEGLKRKFNRDETLELTVNLTESVRKNTSAKMFEVFILCLHTNLY